MKLIKALYKIDKQLASKTAKVLGYKIIANFNNWVRPSDKQIKDEYQWEYVSHIKDRWNLFKNLKDFTQAIKDAQIVTLTKALDAKIRNRSQTKSIKELKNLVSNYRHPRDVDSIVKGFETNSPMAMPIVLKFPQMLYIMSGNTRTDAAFILGIKPKVLIIDVSDRFQSANCEADEATDKFGKILFGDFKELYKKGVNEPDTEYEKRVFEKILDFIRGEFVGKGKDKALKKVFLELLKLKDRYPLVLDPKAMGGKDIYRGSRMRLDNMANIDVTKAKKIKLPDIGEMLVVPCTYKPASIIQSWTSNRKQGLRFLSLNPGSGRKFFNVMYKAQIDPNELLFSPYFLNKIGKKVGLKIPESEIVRVGNNINADLITTPMEWNRAVKYKKYNIKDKRKN